MGTVASNSAVAEEAGYDVVATFTLPESAWWDEYYEPLAARVERMRPEAFSDPDLARAIEETEREIDLYRRYHDDYGYVFYLLRAR
jgi:hypothetical protein